MDFNTSFILPNGLDLGGVATWSVGLAGQLSAIGRRTTLVRHIDSYAGGEAMVPSGVNLVDCPHPIHPNNWYLLKKDIDHYIKAYRRTLPSVLVPNYSFGSYAACACLAAQSADSIRIIGMAHTDNAEYYRWLVRFESIIHVFIAVSHEIAGKLAALLPHRRQDIVCRPCGVPAQDRLTRQYSSPPAPIQLIYAGRLSERQKHVSDLAKLAAILGTHGLDFQLRIYGSGRDQRFLADLIDSLGKNVRDRVKLSGQADPEAMAVLYRSADIFILVSEYEGTSLSMLESMAQGCVPVVTDVSGTAEVIIDGKNGFTVPVGDICSMAERILWLSHHRHRLPHLGSAASATVHDRYSFENYVPWFADILDGIRRQSPRKWQGRQSFVFHFPLRQFIKEAGYTLAAKPRLRWLYRLRTPLKKMIQ